jgi:8-oxo-dGTP diphosphatase
MPLSKDEYINILEVLGTIFTIDKGIVKVLLQRKRTEPYRGYWILPGDFVRGDETLEQAMKDAINEKIGFKNVDFEQHHAYSQLDRAVNNRIIGFNFIFLIDSKSVEIKREKREYETEWFNINSIPKMAYDHETIVVDSIEHLKKKIVNSNVLKSLFPSDFSLPELQNVYEQLLNKDLDRRNFRKKFINLGLIEDTGYKNENNAGRPAKLYRFKEEIKVKDLF